MADTATLEENTTDQLPAGDEQTPVSEQVSQVAEQVSGDGSNGAAEPQFSDDAVSLAEQYGLNPAAFRDEASLYGQVAVIDRQLSQWHRQMQTAQQPAQGKNGGAALTPQQEAQKLEFAIKALAGEQWDEEAVGFSKGVVESLNKLRDYVDSRLGDHGKKFDEFSPLQERLEVIERFAQSQFAERETQAWDEFFSGLGEEFKTVFGDKPWHELNPALQSQRMAVVAQTNDLRQLDQMLGRPPKSATAYRTLALQMTQGHNQNAIARKQLTTQLKQRGSNALVGANGRNATPPPAENRAASFAEKFLREKLGSE